MSRMLQKDYSLSKKVGWKEYAKNSFMLPFKFGGSTKLSALIYSTFVGTAYYCWANGGMELAAKKLLYRSTN